MQEESGFVRVANLDVCQPTPENFGSSLRNDRLLHLEHQTEAAHASRATRPTLPSRNLTLTPRG